MYLGINFFIGEELLFVAGMLGCVTQKSKKWAYSFFSPDFELANYSIYSSSSSTISSQSFFIFFLLLGNWFKT